MKYIVFDLDEKETEGENEDEDEDEHGMVVDDETEEE
jgi:hypothetical protein